MNQLEIGKKIRYLRKEKSVTQDEVAQYLGVTTQAVSKWENEISSPDISLLPAISIFFGITIDELFSITDEAKVERLDNLLDYEREISQDEFRDAELFLKGQIENTNKTVDERSHAYTTLSWLYLHKVQEFQRKASQAAKKGLTLTPFSSDLHKALNNAHKVPIGDWNMMNHAKRIDYYFEFVKLYPNDDKGYLWLLDSLIYDGRLVEAENVLKQYKLLQNRKKRRDWREYHYQALIEQKKGNLEKANQIWSEMTSKYENVSGPWFELGAASAYHGEWQKAIECFEKDFELSNKPRYVDSLDAIGEIYEIMGEIDKAIGTYNRYIKLINEEWNVEEGELINYPKREIERLNNKRIES